MVIARSRINEQGEPATTPGRLWAGRRNQGLESATEGDHGTRQGAERRLYLDAYALTASTVASAVAGLLSLVVAGNLFSDDVVGRAAALTSAMVMLSGVAQLDMTNALHRFLPGSGRSAKRLILGTYGTVAAVAVVATFAFVLLLGEDLFGPNRLAAAIWFSGAVVAWSIFNLQDQVLVGLGATIVVPVENTVFGLARIGLLFAVVGGGAYSILATWIGPVVALICFVSVLIVVRVFPAHVTRSGDALTAWDLRTVSRFVAGSYLGGVTTIIAANVLPLLVLSRLGEAATGQFYIPWLIISTLELVALNFGAALVVQGATNLAGVGALVRGALRRLMVLTAPVVLGIALIGPPILDLVVGELYSNEAGSLLRLLSVGLLARMAWSLYLPAARLRGDIRAMASVQVGASVIVLGCTYAGLVVGGLPGIGWGYICAQALMVLILAPQLASMLRNAGEPVADHVSERSS